MGNTKYIELAKKLYQLSKRGFGGEKENAKNILDALMKKHSISIDDLEENKTIRRQFNYKTDYELEIIKAVMFKVLNVANIQFFVPPKTSKKKYVVFELTDYQYLESNSMSAFYINAFKEELKDFTRAFIFSQKITSDIERDDEDREEKEPTLEERTQSLKIAQMAMSLQKRQYLKLIG